MYIYAKIASFKGEQYKNGASMWTNIDTNTNVYPNF